MLHLVEYEPQMLDPKNEVRRKFISIPYEVFADPKAREYIRDVAYQAVDYDVEVFIHDGEAHFTLPREIDTTPSKLTEGVQHFVATLRTLTTCYRYRFFQ